MNFILRIFVLLSFITMTHASRAALPGQIVELGSTEEELTLPWITDAIDAAIISSRNQAGAALRADGTVVAWGHGNSGLLVAPAGLRDVVKLDGGNDHILALKRDGTVVSFPQITINGFSFDPPAGLSDAVDIGAGYSRSYAVRRDGTVLGWGELGSVPAGLTNVQSISIGEGGYNLALKKDGTIVGWVVANWGEDILPPPGLTNIIAVAAGYDHGLALRSDGTVVGWGSGDAAVVPAGLSDVVEIAAGQNFSLARRRDGSVVTWTHTAYRNPGPAMPATVLGASKLAAGASGAVAVVGPRLLNQVASLSLQAGYDLALGAPSTAPESATFQWLKDNQPITGATRRTLVVPYLQPSGAGTYRVLVNSTASPASTLSVPVGTGQTSYLANLSARGVSGPGEKTMIVGLVNVGSSSRQTLLRGIGPTLGRFGVSGSLADPTLRLFQGAKLVAENDNWADGTGQAATLQHHFAQAGAFGLETTSADSALNVNLVPSSYSAHVFSKGGSGVALMECYDSTLRLEWDHVLYGGSVTGRLLNLSTRAEAGTGEKALIAGFVLLGKGSQRLLFRGVGPTLKKYGVATALSASQLKLHDGRAGGVIAENAEWSASGDTAAMRALSPVVGAFTLEDGSKDAAILMHLRPGVYSVHLTPADGQTGVGLVEVYEADY